MTKLLATLIAGLFATAVFAQAPAPVSTQVMPPAPTKTAGKADVKADAKELKTDAKEEAKADAKETKAKAHHKSVKAKVKVKAKAPVAEVKADAKQAAAK